MTQSFRTVRPWLALARTSALVAAVAGLGLVASGCAREPRVNTAESANPTGKAEVIEDARLIWDKGLSKRVQLVGLVEGASPSGLKKVEAELFNATGIRQAVRYRFEWFDASGFAVAQSMSGWRDLAILSGERARINATAPTDNAVDFQLEIIAAP